MMQPPTTLRSLAGLPNTLPDLAAARVVVIDAQRTYGPGGALTLHRIEAAIERIERLLDEARGRGTPIVHVAHVGGPGSPFDPAAGGRFLDALAPMNGEVVVPKRLPNSFAETDLLEQLSPLEDRPLVIAGFMTHMCVSSTARAALDLGFDTIVLSDATATRALPSVDGAEPIPATVVHAAALAALADRFSTVTSVDRLLAGPAAGDS